MRTCTLAICFLVVCLATTGQDSSFTINTSQKTDFTKYASIERSGFYPFSKAAKISLVSFGTQAKEIDSTDARFKNPRYKGHKDITYGLPFVNDSICLSKLTQVKNLSPSQTDSLSDILYNTCYRLIPREENKAMCYLPHNGILFFDKKGKVFDYIEICFDCHQFKFSTEKIERFEQCNHLLLDLKAYFRQLGLYVTAKELDNTAGH